MAENKNSFIAYLDWGSTFDELDETEAGQLIKLIFNYVRDKDPEAPNRLIKIAFDPIKQDLKRDLKKWVGYIEKQRVNGVKGGRPKETQITQAFFEEPKKADNVFVNVFDNVNVNVNDSLEEPKNENSDVEIEKCLEIALKDERWVRSNKTEKPELLAFNYYLERLGVYYKVPIDYKSHFSRLKKKNPSLLTKNYSIEELRELAKQLDHDTQPRI
jgi:hypothetical protein